MNARLLVFALLSLSLACDSGKDSAVEPDQDGDGHDAISEGGDDCDDADAAVNPSATETWYDGIDQDCSGGSDYDQDGDSYDAEGYEDGNDCDDEDAAINPAAEEVFYDGIDQDCDGLDDEDDLDLDGFGIADDCNDEDDTIWPGAAETWYDGVDSDCDGWSDYDQDLDGFDSDEYGGDDCDDLDAESYPGGVEIYYDDIDQDCAGLDDEYDRDGDGYDCSPGTGECPSTATGDDCNDDDVEVFPSADEQLDGEDNDCDGEGDHWSVESDYGSGTWYGDNAGDGVGTALAAGGDWDGDGTPDLAVVAIAHADGFPGDGAVHVFSGTTIDAGPASVDEAEGVVFAPNGAGMVAAALFIDDLDGDAQDELAVSASMAEFPPFEVGGMVAIYSGGELAKHFGASGQAVGDEADTWIWGSGTGDDLGQVLVQADDVDGDGLAELLVGSPGYSQANGGAFLILSADLAVGGDLWADQTGVGFVSSSATAAGGSVASLGDLDGDGYGDFAVGGLAASDGAGAVWYLQGAAELAGGELDELAQASLTGATAGDGLGSALAGGGDQDGDGLPELLVGAPFQDTRTGVAHVVDGAALQTGGAWAVEDADLVRYNGSTVDGYAGAALAGDLDVDGDGAADMLVGGMGDSAAATGGGTVYLVLAGRTGARALADADASLQGVGTSDMAGASLASADFNGDGLDDLVFGVPGEDFSSSDEGAVYVVFSAY